MRGSLNVGLLLMLIVIALGFAIAWGVTQAVDKSLLLSFALRNGASSDGLISAVKWVSWIGNSAQLSWVALGFAAWIAWDRRFSAAVAMIVIPQLVSVTNSLLKEAFARPRPHLVPALEQAQGLSFPSGHAAGITALCLTAAVLAPGNNPRVRMAIALAGAVAVGVTRVLLAVHYPSDVIGGWIWGSGMTMVCLILAERYGVSRA